MVGSQVPIRAGRSMGLGWAVYDSVGKGEYAISHSGHDPGVHAIVVIMAKSKTWLVIFANSDNGQKLYPDLFNDYLGSHGEAIVAVETRKP